MRPHVEIFTDGACLGNPGPGGWAAVLRYGAHRKEMSGGASQTTNQRMELQAAIEGLSALKRPSKVTLYSDSAYLVNAFRKRWVDRWRINGWQTVNRKPVENQDLWERLIVLAHVHHVEWTKIKGHAGHEENELCDRMAKEAAQQAAKEVAQDKTQ